MKSRLSILNVFAFVFISAFALVISDATAVDILPAQDNTIYEDFPNNSCGIGTGVFIGTNAIAPDGFSRRGLLRFDIANSLPPGTTITAVRLVMNINRSGDNQDAPATLHRILPTAGADWGEGATNCDDVAGGGRGVPADTDDPTWIDRSFNNNNPWATPGGDFEATASATATIPTRGEAIWDSATNTAMVTDVQNWLDNPATNYGWIVRGDETRISTARRFDSREGRTPPLLVVTIAGGVPCCDVNGEFLGICTEVPAGTCQNPPPGPADSCDPNPCPQPVGACCNQDESCSDLFTGDACRASGGIFQGDRSECSDSQVDCGLEPFVDPLPWPVPEAVPFTGPIGGEASYEITMSEISQQLHRDLPDTTVWGYNGSYPGPTLEATVGKPISVKWINDLPPAGHYLTVDTCPHGPNYWRGSSRTVVHLHGGHVPARVDGQPEYDFMPGEFDTYVYPNNQIPATLWYHDHSLGITRLNVYMGLAAYYMLRPDCALTPNDPECNGSLPGKEFEVPAVIQDRAFADNGDLIYPTAVQGGGFFGDKVLVNGKVWPFLNVMQGKYRFRLINGSQARAYTLRMENLANPAQVIPFTLIGTDVGLVSAPMPLNTIHMVPAERFDVVIDFAGFPAGTEIVMRNDDITSPTSIRVPNVMKFIVQGQQGHTADLPATLTPVEPIREQDAATTRWFNLIKVTEECAGSEWLIQSLDGPDPVTANVIGEHWDDITEFPVVEQTEIWEFINPSDMMHPMHVHLVKFQVLDRCPLDGGKCEPLAAHEENTWKDTVRVSSGEKVRVIMKFEDYVGKFPYHCHLLDHEDHEMMRQFQVTHDPALCNNNGICEADEDCESCPSDCPRVSGALCGNKLCETGDGEDFFTCPLDCAGKASGGTAFNCGSDDPADPGYKCGFALSTSTGKPIFDEVLFDGCITNGYYCRVAPRVPACCGDALCEGQETAANCLNDCEIDCIPTGPEGPRRDRTCKDKIDNDCDGLIDRDDPDCQQDCVPTHEREFGRNLCSDGIDNDCDRKTDCDDQDCRKEHVCK